MSTATSVCKLRPRHRFEVWVPTWEMLRQETQLNLTHSQMQGPKMQGISEKVRTQNTNIFHHRQLSFCFVNNLSSSVLPHVHSEVLLPERPVSTFSLFKNRLPLRNTQMRPSDNKFSSRVQRCLLAFLIPISLDRDWLIRQLLILHGTAPDRGRIVSCCWHLS